MSAREGFTVSVLEPATSPPSPNAKRPALTVEIRCHWPAHAGNADAVRDALGRAHADAMAQVDQRDPDAPSPSREAHAMTDDYRTDEAATTLEALHSSLRGWAKGDLGFMTAVEFLIACRDVLRLDSPLTPYDPDGRRHWVDFDQIEQVDMSGGTYATWQLARSIYGGVIAKHAWRLDGQRQAAFVRALAAGLGVTP
jgi:hypothetical protein